MSADGLINIIVIACGVYMVYAAITMKTTGVVPSNLVGKNVDLANAKDIPGFVKKMFPVTLIVGVLTLLCGIGTALGIFGDNGYVQTIISLVFVVIVLVYGKILLDAQKKYL